MYKVLICTYLQDPDTGCSVHSVVVEFDNVAAAEVAASAVEKRKGSSYEWHTAIRLY